MANKKHVLLEVNGAARRSSHLRIIYVTMVLMIRRDAEQRQDLRFDLVDGVVGVHPQGNLGVAKFHEHDASGAALQGRNGAATMELQGLNAQYNIGDVSQHIYVGERAQKS